jgi:hypothetical protein
MKERRRHIRIQVLWPVLHSESIRPKPKTGLPIDMGLAGVAIETRHPFVKGTPLETRIALGSRAVHCSGKVVYVERRKGKRFRACGRFHQITDENRRLPDKHISGSHCTEGLIERSSLQRIQEPEIFSI